MTTTLTARLRRHLRVKRYAMGADPKTQALRQLEQRVSRKKFMGWMSDLYNGGPEDQKMMRDNLADESSRLDHLDDYLNEEHQIRVRPDGLIEFWTADPATRRIIGDLPVAVFHHTTDAIDKKVMKDGLKVRTGKRANPHQNSGAGVYVTTERSGPAVSGYHGNATGYAGGSPRTWTVRTTLDDLSPDPDDQDISSGRHQFVLPYVHPDNLIDDDRPHQMSRRRFAAYNVNTPSVSISIPVPGPAAPAPKPKPKPAPQPAPVPAPAPPAATAPAPEPTPRAFIFPFAPAPRRRMARSKPEPEPLPLATANEYGVTFETGKPVTFNYIRNTEKSPPPGADDQFHQKFEPHGRYMLHNFEPGKAPPGWEEGRQEFKNPLVMRLTGDPSHIYGESGWKAVLSRRFKKTGAALSRELARIGHDGIVTVDDDGNTREILDLTMHHRPKQMARGKPRRYAHSDEPAMHAAIAANPQDNTAGHAYSDMLEENGKPAHAEVVRNYIERFGRSASVSGRGAVSAMEDPDIPWETAIAAGPVEHLRASDSSSLTNFRVHLFRKTSKGGLIRWLSDEMPREHAADLVRRLHAEAQQSVPPGGEVLLDHHAGNFVNLPDRYQRLARRTLTVRPHAEPASVARPTRRQILLSLKRAGRNGATTPNRP